MQAFRANSEISCTTSIICRLQHPNHSLAWNDAEQTGAALRQTLDLLGLSHICSLRPLFHRTDVRDDYLI